MGRANGWPGQGFVTTLDFILEGTTQFEVVYGRPSPPLVPFLPDIVRVQDLADSLRERDEILYH